MKKQKSLRIISNIESIDPRLPLPGQVAAAVDILDRGGVIVFPTQGLYGLGADALNALAVDRIFAIKQRAFGNPLLVLVPERDAVCDVAAEVPPAAIRLMDRFWPGRVTIVLKALSRLPNNLVAGTGRIGVRVSGHPVARTLVSMFGKPITGTSANISGRTGCYRIEDLDQRVSAQLDMILDAGPLDGGRGSTVVDVTGDSPVIIREGAVSRQEILAALN
jgi:L-threonylcarbamoyladenylate synthase